MKCDFCKRDENEIKRIFEQIFAKLDEKIKNIENEIQNKKQNYAQENGFTFENFDKAETINDNFLKMKIKNILSENANFINFDPNIEILSNYFTKYKPLISEEKTLGDLLVLYKKEPTEERINNEVSVISDQKKDLLNKFEEIKSKIYKFEEMEVDINIPLNIFNFNNKTMLYVVDELKDEDEKGKCHKIHLCTFCTYLFKDFSNEIKRAREAVRKVKLNVISDNNDNSSFRDPGF